MCIACALHVHCMCIACAGARDGRPPVVRAEQSRVPRRGARNHQGRAAPSYSAAASHTDSRRLGRIGLPPRSRAHARAHGLGHGHGCGHGHGHGHLGCDRACPRWRCSARAASCACWPPPLSRPRATPRCSSSLTTYYLLPTTYYLLPTTYYLLPRCSSSLARVCAIAHSVLPNQCERVAHSYGFRRTAHHSLPFR